MTRNDEDFLELLKRELDGDVEKIDAATMNQLARGRGEALSRNSDRGPLLLRFAPALAFAASSAVLALLLRIPDGSAPVLDPNIMMIEIVLADGDLELIEDLDFYRWLDANGNAG